MMPELTVACVLRTGTFRGRLYTASWVRRLRDMVARNLSIPHRFVCLCNVDFTLEGIDVLRLENDWPGWWSKIELFSPLLDDAKRVLYLDLDVLVMGSLDEFALWPAPMALAPAIITMPGKPKIVRRYQSSVMVWSPPEGREIYKRFHRGKMDEYRGDQDWIGAVKPDCATFPPHWICKLERCGYSGPPKDVRVVLAVGGKNAEAARRFEWARTVWIGEVQPCLQEEPV